MSFKFSTNFLLSYVRKPAKYGGRGSTGLDATPTIQIHICHPVIYVIQWTIHYIQPYNLSRGKSLSVAPSYDTEGFMCCGEKLILVIIKDCMIAKEKYGIHANE